MLKLRENGLNIDYMYETNSVLRKTAETEISDLTFWLRFGLGFYKPKPNRNSVSAHPYLILRKIIKIVATRCQILTLKCIKIDFGWGSAPDPLAGFKGPISKGRGGLGWEVGMGEGVEKGGRGREGQGGRGGLEPPFVKS